MSKFRRVSDELIEQLLERAYLQGLQFEKEGKQVHGNIYTKVYKACQPQTYTLFGIEIEGEPPLREKPSDPKKVIFTLNLTCGYTSDWADRTQKADYEKGIVFATEQGALTAAKALGLQESNE